MNSVETLVQEGIRLAAMGGRAEALALFRKAAEMDPRCETAWLWLAELAEDDQERIECLDQAVAINPDNPAAKERLQRLTEERLPLGGAAELVTPSEESAPLAERFEEQPLQAEGGPPELPEETAGEMKEIMSAPQESALKSNGQLANGLGEASTGQLGAACSKCGAHNPDGYAFCGMCGADLSLQLPADTPGAGWGCPSCGFVASATDEFCGRCGTRLVATLQGKDETVGQTLPKPSVDAQSGGSEARSIIIGLSVILMAVVTAVYFMGVLDPFTAFVATVILAIPGIWARYALK